MTGPSLTPEEIAQLNKEKAKAEGAAATFSAAVAGQQARAAELAITDGSFKKFFDYYDTNIIQQYDLEKRWINGSILTSPVLESDIVSCASLAGGRLQPSLPATDVIRISQFDGTPTTTDTNNELQHITDQAPIEDHLVNGYPGGPYAVTILTETAITPTSTTLQLKDLTTTFNIPANSVFIVENGGDLAVVKVVTFTMQVSPVPPPYIADLTIELIVPPTGTIPLGKTLVQFTGFTDTERTNKIATVDPGLQPLMNYLVSQLQSKINQRITVLNSELSAIAANQDPEPGTELTTATTNVNASKSFLTNYLITTDISNTGISSLSSERGSRTTQANSRVSQINSAYTGRSKNYYNERYNTANNRANTSRGSLRQQKAAEQTASTSSGFASSLTSQAGAIGSILP